MSNSYLRSKGPFGNWREGGVARPPGGGDNDDMEPRVKALEDAMVTVRDRLTKIETRLDNMPTKADLSDAVHTQTKWVIGIGFALMMAGIGIAKLL
ncbi:hypothetical protein [Bordetella petrii]|uniref:Uncharacterized protein n=1 Tax=Bordetella petrii (strain ATCC BAA-461 / DSM 12804 / CCUG 43448 / CIP 107267 / Se-1111R) TaxID=340100 RepID=A9I8U8_BORPD|nr:hypothetical protein [Bordetella petrii]CAP41291.1 conserved hypothetical protein [Bordetella petrii]